MRTSLLFVSVIAVFSLTACAQTAASPQSEETSKEAGTLGSRICITNATALPMTAAPFQQLDTKNADPIVGEAGALSDTKELCFAGWNAYFLDIWEESWGVGAWRHYAQDVMLSIGIDGDYNVLNFRADNSVMQSPYLYWTTTPDAERVWDGGSMFAGLSKEGNAAGHSFTVTRRGDSEFYKEFLVRFTN